MKQNKNNYSTIIGYGLIFFIAILFALGFALFLGHAPASEAADGGTIPTRDPATIPTRTPTPASGTIPTREPVLPPISATPIRCGSLLPEPQKGTVYEIEFNVLISHPLDTSRKIYGFECPVAGDGQRVSFVYVYGIDKPGKYLIQVDGGFIEGDGIYTPAQSGEWGGSFYANRWTVDAGNALATERRGEDAFLPIVAGGE